MGVSLPARVFLMFLGLLQRVKGFHIHFLRS